MAREDERMMYGQSSSVDLDKVVEVAKKNPSNAIMMLVTYLKLEAQKK